MEHRTRTHNQVDQGEQEEQDDHADGDVALASSQARLVKTLLLDGHVAGFEITVVLLVDVASLDGLLPHGLLHRPVGALLEGQRSVCNRRLTKNE